MKHYIDGIRAEILRRKGMKNLVKGNYKKAGAALNKALELADNTANRFNLGVYLLSQQDFAEAEKIFISIENEYPDNEINRMLLFECKMLMEKWEEALEEIEKLHSSNPAKQDYKILVQVADDVIAREKYRKVKLLKYRAQNELAGRKHSEALNSLKEAEELSPEDPEILNNIGSIFLHQKDNIKAFSYFEKAVKLDSENEIIKKNLLLAKGRLRKNRK